MKKFGLKNIVTGIVLIIVVMLGTVAIKNKWIFNAKDMKTDNYILESGADSQSQSEKKTIQGGEVTISKDQISDMGVPAKVDFYLGKDTSPTYTEEITVTDCSYSKNLDVDYKPNQNYNNRYGEGTFDDNGHILKKYYYLYVDFSVKNTGKKQSFVPREMSYIPIDAHGVYSYDGKLDNEFIYLLDYDKVFNSFYNGELDNFETGETVQFRLVYLVPEEMISANNIYIYANKSGASGITAVTGRDKKFIRLNVEGRER